MVTSANANLHPPGKRSLVGVGETLHALVVKELKVKYKRSILGVLWSLVTPIALAGVYLFVFVHVYHVGQSDFVLFLLAGLLPWHYFNMGLTTATNSFVDNAPLIRKASFPRILVPVATVLANLINFLFGMIVLVVILLASGRDIWTQAHWLALAIIMETAICVGASLALSVWNVYLRDIRQLIGILLLVLFFATPVVYDLSQVPPMFRSIIIANPLTSVIEIYRAALFDVAPPDLGVTALGVAETVLVFLFGLLIFRSLAPHLAKEL